MSIWDNPMHNPSIEDRDCIKMQDERIAQLEAENAELRLEIIAATGQAQTALEENAKLREAVRWANQWAEIGSIVRVPYVAWNRLATLVEDK